jgi:hypothetical protein
LLVGEESPNPSKRKKSKGAKPKMQRNKPNRSRNILINFFVTEQESEAIYEKMKMLKTDNRGAYLRKMAIDGLIVNIDHTDIKKQTAEIQKIGVNVNQIAKRVNQTGNVYAEDILEIKELVSEIWRLQRLSLSKQL